MEADPTETTDVSEAMPEKVAELRVALAQERQHMAPPTILEAEEEARSGAAATEVRPAGGDGARAVVGPWADAPERAGELPRAAKM